MRKIYSLVLMAVGLLVSGSLSAQDVQNTCKIGSQEYATLANAVAAVPTTGTPTTITMINDESMKTDGVTISKGMDVTLELNGKVVSLNSSAHNSATITNLGTLTIQDLTDVSKKGEDCGRITYYSDSPDLVESAGYPAWANNTITNKGILTINSGIIENTTPEGKGCYAIDNQSGKEIILDINGGRMLSGQSRAIRMYVASTKGQTITIENAVIKSLWMQDGEADDSGNLVINNTTFLNDILLGYSGLTDNFKFTITNSSYASLKYELKAEATGNNITISNNKDGQFYMEHPKKILKDGIFSFNGEFPLGWVWYEPEGTDNLESYTARGIRIDFDGPSIDYYEGYGGYYYQGYLSPEAHLHSFYDYIMDGYGLVALDPAVYGERRFEIKPTQNTTGDQDVTDHDGELGNPWHQNKTWDLTKENVVPEETTPVLIDHNVYVEENSQAIAASLQIEAGQTLTVKSGATLQIQDAGALFKDETAQLIIEPNAVVTVGSNGVISQNMENIIIKASATEVGNFLLNPDAHLNTQPLATVKMVANIGMQGSDYKWHRFAMPVTRLENAWGKNPNKGTYLYGWDYENKDWKNMAGSTNMEPFQGYTVTTDEMAPANMEFTFKGNLLGNVKSNIDFTTIGYGYFGNSYTGYILAKTMLADFQNIEGVEGQVWIWDAANQSYSGVSLTDLLKDRDLAPFQREIAPMHTFILKTNSGEGATIDIDYIAAIWGNPRYGLTNPVSAPARATNTDDAFVGIKVISANGVVDRIRMTENAENSDMYENSVDATKYMNENSINLYITVDDEDYTSLYTNNLLGKKLTLQTMDEVSYTLHINDVIGSEYALQDILTGEIISLQAGETYSFSAQPNSTVERFQIVSKRTTPTGTDKVVVTKAAKGIYTMLGQYMGNASEWHKLPAGAYLVDGVKIVK